MLREKFEKQTKRLIIRSYTLADYDVWKLAHLNMDEQKNRWDIGPRESAELTKTYFKKIINHHKKNMKADVYYDLIAFDKKNGAIIGFSSLMDLTRNVFQNAYLGYRVLNPYWRKGYGKEIVKATMEIAFTELNLHRVEAGIDPLNRRSIALAKSCGMRKEGHSKRRLYLNGAWKDMSIYAITAEEMGYHGHTGQLTNNRR